MAFPAEFVPGARAAVGTCLRVQPEEKVTLISDLETAPIAASLAQELVRVGCRWNAFVLEDLAARPLADMPREVPADMETSDVSIFAVQVQRNELKSRMQMTEVVNRRRMRHAHMVNITPQIMCEGMRDGYSGGDESGVQVAEDVGDYFAG
jgi:leucyl aminopeptidase (aminopeptidase T)